MNEIAIVIGDDKIPLSAIQEFDVDELEEYRREIIQRMDTADYRKDGRILKFGIFLSRINAELSIKYNESRTNRNG